MYRGVFDRNWYTESKAGKCIDGIHPNDAYNVELMQYTGLKDKNGVEIYEGDIVSIQYDNDQPTIHEVVWCGIDYPAFDFQPQLNCECNGFSHYHNDPDTIVEVIGNIYENPELLEK